MKKTVGTRRGVEPLGRPQATGVERDRRARTNSPRTFAQRAGRPRSRAARPGGATVVAPAEVAIKSDGRIVGRRRRAVVVVNQSSFEIRHISNISGGRREKGKENRRRTAAPSARRHVPPGVLVVLERLLRSAFMAEARPSLLGPRSTRKVQPVQSSRASFLWLFSSVAMVLCAALAP